MTTFKIFLLTLFVAGMSLAGKAQDEWPRTINTTNGSIIKVYEPEPESFSGNTLKSRAAISIQQDAQSEPVFGTFWSVAVVETDRDNRRLSVQTVKVPNLKFPSDVDANTLSYIKTSLEAQLPALESDLPLDGILSSLASNTEQKKLSQDMSNKPPKIYYTDKPSMLVSIDGKPQLKKNDDWGVSAVVNSPFTIVKNNDGAFYLYGGKKWYKAKDALGPYSYAENVPANLSKVETAVNSQENADAGYRDSAEVAQQSNGPLNIVVSTEPAELIQTAGNPVFKDIDGTNLQYVDNTENDLFMDEDSQQYYVLLSGRWYKAGKMNGPWEYTASNTLPADFAKIPEGSPKDNVLASIPGTNAAREAVMDAQIPQTAKVDRHAASTSVNYDGTPKFEPIAGTNLTYAENTSSSVIGYRGKYYAVDKGVWFVSDSPTGPWEVSTDRPDEVESIPPSSPAYNLKYVYVYDVTPDYVYMGYTPGYLNNFVYGGTVIYGTGYFYRPWWGTYYYPRPCTWGFGVSYNPWWGWNLGFGFGGGWFHGGFGYNSWPGWGGGWWGPSIYRPPYRYYSGYHRTGYYGGGRYYGGGFRGGRTVVRNNITVINNRNNIYRYRNDVVTNNGRPGNGRSGYGRPGGGRMDNNGGGRGSNGFNNNGGNRPGFGNNGQGPRAGNGAISNPGGGRTNGDGSGRVYTDHNGSVYQRGPQGQWQQRDQKQWQPVDNNRRDVIQELNRQQQQQNRGQQRQQSFQQFQNRSNGGFSRPAAPQGGSRPSAPQGGFSRPSAPPSGGYSRPSGGGSRPSGGGGGRSGRH